MTTKPVLTFWRGAGIVLFLIVAALTVLTITSALARPNITTDYAAELAQMAREYQPGHETQPNRREEFIAILDEMTDLRDTRFAGQSIDIRTILEPDPHKPSEFRFEDEPTWVEQRALAEQFLDTLNANGFFDRAAAIHDIRHAVNELPIGASLVTSTLTDGNPLEKLGAMQQLCRVATTQAVRAARAGDANAALREFETALANARLSSYEPFLISGLVASSHKSLATQAAVQILTEHTLTRSQIDDLERVHDRQHIAPFEYALKSERAILLDLIQRTHSDNGKGDGFLLIGQLGPALGSANATPIPSNNTLNVIGRFFPSRSDSLRVINAMYDAAIAYSRNPTADTSALDTQAAVTEKFADRHLIFGIFIPALSHTAISAAFNATSDAALATAIALERHRLDHSTYPQSLEALVPTYLPELPKDPLAKDGRLIYTPTEDGAAYTLHAVGRNGIDNHGEEDDITFTPN